MTNKAFDCEHCEYWSRLTDGYTSKDKTCTFDGDECAYLDKTNEQWFELLSTEDKAVFLIGSMMIYGVDDSTPLVEALQKAKDKDIYTNSRLRNEVVDWLNSKA